VHRLICFDVRVLHLSGLKKNVALAITLALLSVDYLTMHRYVNCSTYLPLVVFKIFQLKSWIGF
jgi:hypothetical protein